MCAPSAAGCHGCAGRFCGLALLRARRQARPPLGGLRNVASYSGDAGVGLIRAILATRPLKVQRDDPTLAMLRRLVEQWRGTLGEVARPVQEVIGLAIKQQCGFHNALLNVAPSKERQHRI